MEERRFDISSAGLHILAMALMLLDHAWHTVVPGNDWMTCLGRIAFPIFAFMIVQGYFHTHSLKRYALRMLLYAVVSEIPFNLMAGGYYLYPFHQNVLWTFLMGLGAIHLNELARRSGRMWLRVITAMGTVFIGYVLGYLTMVDYYGAGVVMVLGFYFFRGRSWMSFIGQLAVMYYLNCVELRGFSYEIEVLGSAVLFPRQGFALLALIPIWLYRGRQGYSSRWFRRICYWFYPAHMAALVLIAMLR